LGVCYRHGPQRRAGEGDSESNDQDRENSHLVGVNEARPSLPASAASQFFGSDRQFPDALAGAGEDGVTYRRREGRHTGFSDTAGWLVARHDVDLNHWHFIHSQHRIIVEVALLHLPLSIVIAPYSAAVIPRRCSLQPEL
jgi:hypothetical protein